MLMDTLKKKIRNSFSVQPQEKYVENMIEKRNSMEESLQIMLEDARLKKIRKFNYRWDVLFLFEWVIYEDKTVPFHFTKSK